MQSQSSERRVSFLPRGLRQTTRFLVREFQSPIVIKDQNYYRDKSWENSYLASGKLRELYCTKELQRAESMRLLKHQMKLEEAEAKEVYREQLSMQSRKGNIVRHMNRVTLRNRLQTLSRQRIGDSSFEGNAKLLKEYKNSELSSDSSKMRKATQVASFDKAGTNGLQFMIQKREQTFNSNDCAKQVSSLLKMADSNTANRDRCFAAISTKKCPQNDTQCSTTETPCSTNLTSTRAHCTRVSGSRFQLTDLANRSEQEQLILNRTPSSIQSSRVATKANLGCCSAGNDEFFDPKALAREIDAFEKYLSMEKQTQKCVYFPQITLIGRPKR